jgi:NTP pyrophosphatase (non-canonical NTP hydrolase)
MKIGKIFDEVLKERERQIKLWEREFYVWDASLEHKNTVLVEEVGEVAHAILENDIDNLREELIQVAAVCVAWLETLEDDSPLIGS